MVHSNYHSRLDKAMTTEQFTQVVEAILAGKYSWACVLILRFAGYNPLHYIPYRTYNRLMKENCPEQTKKSNKTEACHASSTHCGASEQISSVPPDLTHLETLEEHRNGKRESDRPAWVRSSLIK